MKQLLIAGISLLICSCATGHAAKQQINQYGYTQYAWNRFMATECVAKGMFAPEVGALANEYSDAILSNLSYDPIALASWIEKAKELPPVTAEQCNLFAMHVAQKKNEIEAAKERQRQQDANSPVTCSTTLGITRCY